MKGYLGDSVTKLDVCVADTVSVEVESTCLVLCVPEIFVRPNHCFWVQPALAVTQAAKKQHPSRVLVPIAQRALCPNNVSACPVACFIASTPTSVEVEDYITSLCFSSRLIPKNIKKIFKKVPWLLINNVFRNAWHPSSEKSIFFYWLTSVYIVEEPLRSILSLSSALSDGNLVSDHQDVLKPKYVIAEGPLWWKSNSVPRWLDSVRRAAWMRSMILISPKLESAILTQLYQRIAVNNSVIVVRVNGVEAAFLIRCCSAAALWGAALDAADFTNSTAEKTWGTTNISSEVTAHDTLVSGLRGRLYQLGLSEDLPTTLLCVPQLSGVSIQEFNSQDMVNGLEVTCSTGLPKTCPVHIEHYINNIREQIERHIKTKASGRVSSIVLRSFLAGVSCADSSFVDQKLREEVKELGTTLQLHTLPADIHFANAYVYRQNMVWEMLSPKASPHDFWDRMSLSDDNSSGELFFGALNLTTIVGNFVLSYCKERVRAAVDVLSEVCVLSLSANVRHYRKPHLVIVRLEKLESVTLKEWEEVRKVLTALITEVDCLCKYRFVNNEGFPSQNVLLHLLGTWNDEMAGPLYDAVEAFFNADTVEHQVDRTFKTTTRNMLQQTDTARREETSKRLHTALSKVTPSSATGLETLECSQHQAFPSWEAILSSHQEGVLSCHGLHRLSYAYEAFVKCCKHVGLDHLYFIRRMLPELAVAFDRAQHFNTDTSSEVPMSYRFPPFSLDQRRVLKELDFYVFYTLRYPEFFLSAGVPQRSRVLLTGPSGSGKTTLINYLSLYYSAIHLVVVDLTSLYSPFVGETEKNVVSVFEQVKNKSPALVVLEGLEYLCAAESVVGQDETQDVAFANRQIREHTERPIHDLRNESQDVNSSDTLQENELSNFPDAVSAISHLDVSTNSEALSFSRCSSRSDDTFRRKVLTTLLLCLDGISSDASLNCIGVSRLFPSRLDSALTRPGRFDRWLTLPPRS